MINSGATIDIDLSHVKFLGNLTLNLWDCGGQEAFMENYLSQQRVHVFSNVGVLIYVFDIESRDVDRDMATYVSILSALTQFSPTAKIYVLIHKMDLIMLQAREAVFTERVRLVRQKTGEFIQGSGYPGDLDLIPFATSIWDQSLYKAWASIIHDLVPNLSVIESQLESLGILIEAEELLLFERTSFLVVSSWTSDEGHNNPTEDRLERISNILKHFKQSISRFTGTPRNAEQFSLMVRITLPLLKWLYTSSSVTSISILNPVSTTADWPPDFNIANNKCRNTKPARGSRCLPANLPRTHTLWSSYHPARHGSTRQSSTARSPEKASSSWMAQLLRVPTLDSRLAYWLPERKAIYLRLF